MAVFRLTVCMQFVKLSMMVQTEGTTRERIFNAATTLFARYGYRRTTMEDIASEAGLSRTSLYLQFRNKEDIFREGARTLHEQSIVNAEAALRERAPLADRLRRAMEAKTLRMMEISHASPHGSELMDQNNRLCGDLAMESEERFIEMLKQTLTEADEAGEIQLSAAGLSPEQAAEMILYGVTGLKRPGVSLDAYKKRLEAMIRVFVAGLQQR